MYENFGGQSLLHINNEFDHFRFLYLNSITTQLWTIYQYYCDHEDDFDSYNLEFSHYFRKLLVKYHSSIYWLSQDPDPVLLSPLVFHANYNITPGELWNVHVMNAYELTTFLINYHLLKDALKYNPVALRQLITPSDNFNFRFWHDEEEQNAGLIEEIDSDQELF